MRTKALRGNRDRLLAAGVSRGAPLADHKEMRSINVESSVITSTSLKGNHVDFVFQPGFGQINDMAVMGEENHL